MKKIILLLSLLVSVSIASSYGFNSSNVVGVWELRSYKSFSKVTFLDENTNTNKDVSIYALFTSSGKVIIKNGVSRQHNWFVKNGLLYTSKSPLKGNRDFRSKRFTDVLYIRNDNGNCLNVSYKKRGHGKYWNKDGFWMCKMSKTEIDFIFGRNNF